MRDPRDFKVELNGGRAGESAEPPSGGLPRSYISVHFTCCNVYLRIYRSADATGYRGHCPKCGRQVSFLIGLGGTDARIFRC